MTSGLSRITGIVFSFLLTCFSHMGWSQCWRVISCNLNHTVAIKDDGTLWAWGSNAYGQLGTGSNNNEWHPMQVGTDNDWQFISTSCMANHSFAIKTDGTLWGWGLNDDGQLGNGTTVHGNLPVQIGEDSWLAVSCGISHTCAIQNNGTLWCWGSNDYGQLGDGTTIDHLTPNQTDTMTHWAKISCGGYYNMATTNLEKLWSWGKNDKGQLGNSTTTQSNTPGNIATTLNWKVVSCGFDFTLGVATDNRLWAWGNNLQGQLGVGINTYTIVPLSNNISGMIDYESVSCGKNHAIGLKTNGELRSWGSDAHYQLGNTEYYSDDYPMAIAEGQYFEAISAGGYQGAAIDLDAGLFAWGENCCGQVGVNTIDPVAVPTYVDCLFVENVLESNQSTTSLSFFPNPANDKITFNQTVGHFKIYAMDGKYIEVESNGQTVSLPQLESGLYTIVASTSNHQNHILRLVYL